MDAQNLEIRIASEAAQAAGEIIRRAFTARQEHLSEPNRSGDCNKKESGAYQGIVTETDLQSEQAIASIINSAFPTHDILSEESLKAGVESEHLWIIDPLDGTNNFAHGISHFAVSIAYVREGVTECGIVFEPIRKDIYAASKGAGATLNGQPVRVNNHASLAETMLAVGFYYDRGEMMRATLAAIDDCFSGGIHGIRRMGTAALDIVSVGCGRFGGFFEFTLSPWDFAAAKLFLEEAGGQITDCFGNALPHKKSSVAASNGTLHSELLSTVGKHCPRDES